MILDSSSVSLSGKSFGYYLSSVFPENILKSLLFLLFSFTLSVGYSQNQTYQFPNELTVGGGFLTGTNEISTVYNEGSNDPLLLTMKEVGQLDCQGPTIYMTGGRLLILGCGVSNSQNYDKVFEIRKNNGDSFNAESVSLTPSTYRVSSSQPYELLLNVYIRGYKNNVQKGEIHLTNLVHAQNYPINFSSYSGFDDIDMLYFFVDNQDLWVDNLTLSPLVQTPVLPTLSTSSATGVLSDRAVLGGTVSNDGGAAVTSRGIVWSTSSNPTISSTRVNNGSGTGTFSATVTGLPAASTVYVRAFAINSAGVAYGNQISFTTPAKLTAQILSITNESCLGNDGAVSIGANGGRPPYSYLWLFDNSTLSSRNDLTAGTYTIRVTDAAGEVASAIAILGAQDPLNVSLTLSQVSCAGGNNGSATVSVTGGSGVYTYTWSLAGQTGTKIENLSAGNYSVTVRDQSGCQSVQNFTITEPDPLAVSVSSITNASCIGGNNGAIEVSVSGGTPPYTYIWNPINDNSPAIFNLTAGAYQVLVRDANSCEVSQTITVEEPDRPLIVNTGNATEIAATSARISGSASKDLTGFGESESCVAKAGFVYGTSSNPDFLSGTVSYVNPFSLSGFSSLLQNLRPNTVYFVRAFVESATGAVTYGNPQSFTTEALDLTIGGTFSVVPKTYDGNNSAQFSFYGLVLSGLNPDFNQVALENVVIEFETPEAGINKVVRIVSASITGTDAASYNFSTVNSPVSSGTIFKKNLTLTGLTANSKTYDGSTIAAVTGTPALSGVLDGDVVTLSGTPQYNFLNANAGDNLEINTTGISLSGTDASNYELFIPSLFANILKRQLEMEDPTITSSKIYDGNTLAASILGDPINKVSGDDLIVSGSAQYEDSNVGTNKQIALSYTLSGNSAVNYFPPFPFVKTDGEITPAELQVTVSSETKVFGDLDPVFMLLYNGFVSGDNSGVISGNPDFSRDPGENVGNYSVGVNGLSASNYSLRIVEGNLEITPLRIQLTLPFLSKFFGEVDPTLSYEATPALGTILSNGTRVELNGSLERQAGEDVGTYIIDIGTVMDLNPNYLIGYVGGSLSILPREVRVTADRLSKTYGDLDPAFTYTSIPAAGETLSNGITVSFTGELQRQAGETVGSYRILKGSLSNPNFNIVFQEGVLEITPFTLEVRSDAQSKVYGELDPILSYAASPSLGTILENGEVISLTGELQREPGENVGTYRILQGSLSNPNLNLNYVGSMLEITPLSLEVRADNQSKIYGELDPFLSFVSSPAIGTKLPNGQEISLSGELERVSGEEVGTYVIGRGNLSNDNLTINFISSTLEITQRQISVVAVDKEKVYGQIDPELTYISSPAVGTLLPNGEAITFFGNLSRDAGEEVGVYPINAGSLANPNYAISFTASVFEITPLAIAVRVEAASKVYGQLDPEFRFISVPSLGTILPNGMEVAFTGNLERVPGEDVGLYDIQQGTLANSNFQIFYEKASLQITPLPVQVTANDRSKLFGDLDPSLTYTSLPAVGTVLENGLKISFTGNLIRQSGENIGSYPILQGDLSNSNYQLVYLPGTFTINPLRVQVVANSASKVYGQVDPPLTFASSIIPGSTLSNGQTFSLTGGLGRNPGEDVGIYAITQGTLTSPNIQIDFVSANFEITPKVLEVIPKNGQSKIYGEVDPDFIFSVNGLVPNEPSSIISGSISRKEGENAGTYDFNLGNVSAGKNYMLLLKGEVFTINRKSLTVRAENKEKLYGDPNPPLTFVLEGLVNGDSGLDQMPLISTTATQLSPVGTYPIVLSGGSDANYSLNLVNAEMRVLKRKVKVIADDQEMIYGDPIPSLTYQYDGLVNGDLDLEVKPEIKTSASSTSDVGTYPIQVNGGSDSNYFLEYQNATLTVKPRSVQVIVDSKSRGYGDPNPSLTYSLAGLVNGDKDLINPPTLITSASQSSFVGKYPITVSGGSHPNYTISYQDGILEILPAELIVSALPGSKVFGAADPVLSFSATGFKLSDQIGIATGKLERSPGESIGIYSITIGSLSFGNNYQVTFRPADFEIVAVEILAITDPAEIQTPWGIVPELPNKVQLLTQDARIISGDVIWEADVLNVYARGVYFLKGQVLESEQIQNPNELSPTIKVTVLPKPAPEDIRLSNNRFIPDPDNYFQAIGSLQVIDPVDNIHVLSLVQRSLDNAFFEIKDNILFWSSAEQAPGKSQFTIRVQAFDRDGNTLVKDFIILRERVLLESLEVYNSFSPNGDGFNETWGVPDLRYYRDVRVHIFNVEGRRVFYTEDPDFRWDGKFNGVELSTDTFQWVIEIKETGEKRNGYLHLIR